MSPATTSTTCTATRLNQDTQDSQYDEAVQRHLSAHTNIVLVLHFTHPLGVMLLRLDTSEIQELLEVAQCMQTNVLGVHQPGDAYSSRSDACTCQTSTCQMMHTAQGSVHAGVT